MEWKGLSKLRHVERILLWLQDTVVINALLIVVMALVYLVDIARYQWILYLLLFLGITLNLLLFLGGLLRRWPALSAAATLLMAGLLAVLVYLAVF